MIAEIDENLTVEWDENGSGTPLVLLHAFPQTAQMWQRQRDDLSDVARVLFPNLRGFGASRHAASTCTIDEMARDIASWMKHLNLPPAIVGGVSMGGYVAMSLARQFPEKLRGLILADTRADADDEMARQNRGAMLEFAQTHTAREVFEKMAPKLFAETSRQNNPQSVESCAQIAADIPRDTILRTIAALRDRPDARPQLPQIAVPTLILVGSDDAVTTIENAQEMQNLIPNARLQVLVDAGHFAFIEQFRAFNQAARDFLDELNTHKNMID